jgi:hypothetical protein
VVSGKAAPVDRDAEAEGTLSAVKRGVKMRTGLLPVDRDAVP